MPPAPLVSILLPARNEAARLGDALADCRAQSHRELEIIVIDDGSTDDTPAVVANIAAHDERVRLFATPPQGIASALNRGLAEARGDIVARMDADDRCAPTRLARQLGLLRRRPEIGFCSCLIGPPAGESYAGGYAAYADWVNGLLEPAAIRRERFVECPIVHPTLAIRRDVLRAIGGWRDGDFPEDYDLVLRLLAAGAEAAKVPEMLYFWRDRPARASRIDPRYRPAAFAALKARFLADGPLRGRKEIVVWGAGKISRRLLQPLLALGHSVKAWIDIDPRKIGRRRSGAPVLPPDALPGLRGLPILVYVGSRGARELIRPKLVEAGFVEGVDAWFCA
jgi:glycosyltransferase involved in cell wall biosynthesis